MFVLPAHFSKIDVCASIDLKLGMSWIERHLRPKWVYLNIARGWAGESLHWLLRVIRRSALLRIAASAGASLGRFWRAISLDSVIQPIESRKLSILLLVQTFPIPIPISILMLVKPFVEGGMQSRDLVAILDLSINWILWRVDKL